MKDFNFFKELAVSRKKKTSSATYVLSASILLVLALGAVSYYYIHQFRTLRTEKAALESQLNDPNLQQQYNEALALQEKVIQLETEKAELDKIHGSVLNSRVINSLLLKEISMAKPDAIAIKSIFLTPEGISIEGSSVSYDLIARFEHNLRANARFSGPFVPSIQKVDEGYYNFTMNFTFYHQEPESEPEGEDIVNGEG